MKKYWNMLRSAMAGNWVLDERMLSLGRARKIAIPPVTNYIRISTLELCAQELAEAGVQGSVAELGVYKGNFAKYINRIFPDRTFYLFDTFEGFDGKDVAIEQQRGFGDAGQSFSNTSVQGVMALMQHPGKIVVKQGRFPESLDGLEDRFCFVSLDADLYQPIADGLTYFYPRLNPGGFIFVHDYNNAGYPGAKQAVREFCAQQGIPFVPVSDSWGSVIIRK